MAVPTVGRLGLSDKYANGVTTLILDLSQLGQTLAVPTVGRLDVGDKYANGITKVRKLDGRSTCQNVRTLRSAREVGEMTQSSR